MAELKTRPTDASVDDFITGVEGEARQADCRTLVEMMRRVTGAEPVTHRRQRVADRPASAHPSVPASATNRCRRRVEPRPNDSGLEG